MKKKESQKNSAAIKLDILKTTRNRSKKPNPLLTMGNEKNTVQLGQRRIRDLSLRWNKDLFYRSIWVRKLIGKITKHGKRAKAEKIVFSCLAEINQICRGYPQIIFYEVLNKLKPTLTIVVKRKGRRFYQVPVPVKTIRQYIMALNWIVEHLKTKHQTPPASLLTEEFLNAYFFQKSEVLKKKDQLSQLVIKNKAFNNYRWI